jgi:hypothetical protein
LTSRTIIGVLITVALASTGASGQPSKIAVGYASGNVIRIVADSAAHVIYGLSYPVTYKVSIPLGSAELSASRRYSTTDAWYRVREKSSEDFFNGEEVVRFDYAASCAYVSVPFGSTTDTVYLKITKTSGQAVAAQYVGVCTYYDNRKAAVTITADDWQPSVDEDTRHALSIFRSYRLWVSVGIITKDTVTEFSWDSTGWSPIQQELDSGCVEAASHSRTHPLTPYADPVSEITGSKEDILQNLDLPAVFKNGSHQYVYAWIAPYGLYDRAVDSLVAVDHYLVARVTSWPMTSFSDWDNTKGRFDTAGVTRDMDPYWGADTSLTDLNNAFDAAVASGGIYHLMCHPWALSLEGDWDKPFTLQHLSHISNRKDIWYVPFGLLYLYRWVAVNVSSMTDTIIATADGRGVIAPSGAVMAIPGTNQSFTMTPDVGAQLDSVLVDGVKVDSTTSYTFVNVAGNHTIVAYFSPPSGLLPDEFSGSSLNGIWTFINPRGDVTLTTTGSQVSISVPAGTNHDVWTDGNNAARIMQTTNNADFEVTLKFDSPMTAGYQMQGLIAQQDTGNYLRFDFVYGASMTRIYAASFAGGSVTVRKDSAITNGSPLYLRVKRVGNQWTESFSYNGTTWVSAVSFSYTLVISSVGPFVGNYGNPQSSAPFFAELIDYFRTGAITANLKAFLEGPFTTPGDSMRTSLRQQGYVPLKQPYGVSPWNYAGTDSVASIPSAVVDWVLVELRTDTSAASRVASRAGFIKGNGSIVDLDGVSPVSFPNVSAGNYYVVIRHRNHLAIMSHTAIALSQASGMYDLTTSQSQAYGTNPMKLVGTTYVMYAGDGNQSGIVTAADANAAYAVINTTGYSGNDVNLSGIVTAADANVVFGNLNKAAQVP